jgi:hypothetical protein
VPSLKGEHVRAWGDIRTFALRLPAAEEDDPWGEAVIKVRRKPGVPPWRKDGAGFTARCSSGSGGLTQPRRPCA